MKETLNYIFTVNKTTSYIDEKIALIKDAVLLDKYRKLDYGFSYDDFINSFDSGLDVNHVPLGINEYILIRINSANVQLNHAKQLPYINNGYFIPNSSIDSLQFFADITYKDNISEITIYYNFDSGNFYDHTIMNDKGIDGDKIENDGKYSTPMINIVDKIEISYYYLIKDINNKVFRYPACESYNYKFPSSTTSIVINEFMAKNKNTIADSNGEYDDWIELLNVGNDSIFLGDLFLTDDKSVPDKWQMPDQWLSAKNYILIWADKDELQGDNHCNFKLSSKGEYLGIYLKKDTNSYELKDEYQFGVQEEDISYGRLPNGVGSFMSLSPTPGTTNSPLDIEDILAANQISVFPNPCYNILHVFCPNIKEKINIEIFDRNGKLIATSGEQLKDNIFQFSLNHLEQGVYFIRIKAQQKSSIKRFVKI